MRPEKWKISVVALAVTAWGFSAGAAVAARDDRMGGQTPANAPVRAPQQHATVSTPQSVTTQQSNTTGQNRSFDRDRDRHRARSTVFFDLGYSGYYYPGYYDPGYWVNSYGPGDTNCYNSYYGYYGYYYNGYCYRFPPSDVPPY